jgi:hypothetical protein
MTEETKCGSNLYVPYGVTSFKDYDALQAAREETEALSSLISAYQQMLGNIFYSSDVSNRGAAIKALTDELVKRMENGAEMDDKALKELFPLHIKSPIKRENGLDFPARDYAFVPDPSLPSTWKLRLSETPGEITVGQLAKAAAAVATSGVPAATLSAVKRRIRAEYRKLHVADTEIPSSVRKGFMTWKSADGQLRWLATYSNNFRDRDNPPEIISEKSHKSYVELVRKGIVDYPELWHWHIPGTVWGKATWVDYADGFALASGIVYPGFEQQAENLSKMADIRVSHGMPSALIQRNKADKSIIDFHVTTEISPLPGWAAANELTDFLVIPQEQKMLTVEQKDYLTSIGLEASAIETLSKGLENKAATAAALKLEQKAAKKTPAEMAAEEDAADGGADDDEEDESGKKKPAKKDVSTKEIADAVAATMAPVLSALTELGQRYTALETEIKALKSSDEQKVAKAANMTPALSLQALIAQAIVGNEAARVDGRSTLAKSGPKTTTQPAINTGIGFLDTLLSGTQEDQQ